MPTEATVANVLFSKNTDHLPLYRRAQIYSCHGVDLDRSTLADWVGRAAFELRSVFDTLMADLKRSTKLFMDETRPPVLNPGRARPGPATSGPLPDRWPHRDESHAVERTIRPNALNRKSALFAGHDAGAENWADIASLIETCKINAVDSHAWLATTLTAVVSGHKQSQIHDLLPWNYAAKV